MIGARHQKKGYGKSALTLLFTELRARPFTILRTSVVPGEAGPLAFYRANGFRETGAILPNGEVELSLAL